MSERHWWVVSPEMVEVIDVIDYGQGPAEYFHDVECVEARTKREARIAGVRKFKKWTKEARNHGVKPFGGVKVKSCLCPHGVCFCEIPGCPDQNDYCEECEKETQK